MRVSIFFENHGLPIATLSQQQTMYFPVYRVVLYVLCAILKIIRGKEVNKIAVWGIVSLAICIFSCVLELQTLALSSAL